MQNSVIVDEHVVYLNLSPYYSIDLEFLWWGVIAHTTVHKIYNKTVLIKYKHDLNLIASNLSQPMYCYQTSRHDQKNRKFITRLGFHFHHFRYTEDGEKAEIYHFEPLTKKEVNLWADYSNLKPK